MRRGAGRKGRAAERDKCCIRRSRLSRRPIKEVGSACHASLLHLNLTDLQRLTFNTVAKLTQVHQNELVPVWWASPFHHSSGSRNLGNGVSYVDSAY